MTFRPLHAVLLPPLQSAGRLLDLLGAALDGSGPAILPLDPALPRPRLAGLIDAFAPDVLVTASGSERTAATGSGSRAGTGVAEDVAVVLATSGSTGRPKAAELTAAALLASARASLARLGAAPGQRWLCCLPPHHISGLGILVRSLLAGSAPVMPAGPDAEHLVRAVFAAADGGDRCEYVSLVPTQLRRLLDAGAPVDGFRGILLGGAAAPGGLTAEAEAAGARVVTTYGMTETCGGCVYDGVPLDGVRVASRASGRIAIAGPVLFSRYRLDPALTAEVLDGGWFLTSDLGGPGPEGRLVVRGRADDVIISGGENVVAAEVESALRGHAGVRDAVVVGVPDPEWGELVTALVVADEGADPPTLAGLRAAVGGTLPRYAAPRRLVLVPNIPLLTSGKPDRRLLRQMAAQESGHAEEDFRQATAGRETNRPVTRYT